MKSLSLTIPSLPWSLKFPLCNKSLHHYQEQPSCPYILHLQKTLLLTSMTKLHPLFLPCVFCLMTKGEKIMRDWCRKKINFCRIIIMCLFIFFLDIFCIILFINETNLDYDYSFLHLLTIIKLLKHNIPKQNNCKNKTNQKWH